MSYLDTQPGIDTRMLVSSDYLPPADLRITEMRGDGDDRSATISFKVDGQEHKADVRLTKRQSRTLGVFRDWTIDGTAVLLVSTSAAVSAQVDGIAVGNTANNTREPVVVRVLPGRHKVDIADNPLLEGGPVTVVAESGSVEVPLSVQVKASAKQAAETQVKQYLDQCAAEKTLAPKGCPFAVSSYYGLGNVAWKIATYPTIEIRQQDNTGGVYVRTRDGSRGRVILTGTRSTGTAYEDDISFEVTGGLRVDQGKLVFTPF
jgi:hypothetical protein